MPTHNENKDAMEATISNLVDKAMNDHISGKKAEAVDMIDYVKQMADRNEALARAGKAELEEKQAKANK
jgi:hypothetical protein